MSNQRMKDDRRVIEFVEVLEAIPEQWKPGYLSFNHKSRRWMMAGMFVPRELAESLIVERAHQWLMHGGCRITRELVGEYYEWIEDQHIVRAERTLGKAADVQTWIDQRDGMLGGEEGKRYAEGAEMQRGAEGEDGWMRS